MEGSKTLKDFTNLYDIPYTVVTLLYCFVLVLVCLIVVITRVCKCCKEVDDENENCCSYSWWVIKVTKFSSWLVRLVFGKSEGISEGADDLRISKDIIINGHVLDRTDTNILGVIILCFGLLVGITSYSAYLLEVSHTCSEDTAIYCFPQFINQNDPENPNITQDEFLYPITDCSQWTNSSVSAKITFQCFRYALNAQGALVVAGGLLSFFTVAIRIILSTILWLLRHCRKCKRGERCIVVTQVVVVVSLLLLDIAIALIVMSFQLAERVGFEASEMEAESTPVAQQVAAYVADNGVQFLIIISTTTLLSLLNWKEYAN